MVLQGILGQFVFINATVPFQEFSRSQSWKHPSQGIVGGGLPPVQYTGRDNDEITISAELRPEITGGANTKPHPRHQPHRQTRLRGRRADDRAVRPRRCTGHPRYRRQNPTVAGLQRKRAGLQGRIPVCRVHPQRQPRHPVGYRARRRFSRNAGRTEGKELAQNHALRNRRNRRQNPRLSVQHQRRI